MHPAFSVIFLTTLIGVGQGLFLALFTVESYAAFGLLPPRTAASTRWAALSRWAFSSPAWSPPSSTSAIPSAPGAPRRKWRTSWLSREVIVLPAFMGTVFLYGAAHFSGFNPVLATLPSGHRSTSRRCSAWPAPCWRSRCSCAPA
jgi:hypothetical protein